MIELTARSILVGRLTMPDGTTRHNVIVTASGEGCAQIVPYTGREGHSTAHTSRATLLPNGTTLQSHDLPPTLYHIKI